MDLKQKNGYETVIVFACADSEDSEVLGLARGLNFGMCLYIHPYFCTT